MVALSKLLVGALIQSAYGKADLETAAQTVEVKATITQGKCSEAQEYGHFTVEQEGGPENCTLESIDAKEGDLFLKAKCGVHDVLFNARDEQLLLEKEQGLKIFTVDGDNIYVGEDQSELTKFDTSKCILVKTGELRKYEIKITKFHVDEDVAGAKIDLPTVGLTDAQGIQVAKSALFGTKGGEWDILDLFGIVAACVLVCCLGLALYGCWSKKQKQEAEQRQTKYVAQNSNPSGRTGTQRRRR